MSWHTPLGRRFLKDSEARVFRAAWCFAVDMVKDGIDSDDLWPFDVDVLDQLEPWTQLALLADIGGALLRPTAECPPLTAVTEAAVAAIFQTLNDCVQAEMDTELDASAGELADSSEGIFWRCGIRDAIRECCPSEEIPAIRNNDRTEWEFLVECLSNRVLWDNDFAAAETMLDLSPDQGAAAKRTLGIDADYYVWTPLSPKKGEYSSILARLNELRRG